MRVALVLPRYGKNLGGGAETLSRALFLELIGRGAISYGEVWTTCAVDHRTWENALPEGETSEDGVVVRRFPVDERDLETFIRAEQKMGCGERLSVREQLDWMGSSVNSGALYQHISGNGRQFDLLIFAPYLFATTFWGALIHPERSVLIPCLHDEAYAYQEVIGVLFHKVRGLLFNTAAEQRLAERLYPGVVAKGAVVGMGFEQGSLAEVTTRTKSYLLYSGRKELGKNLGLLLEYYEMLPESLRNELELILIGSGEVDFRKTLPAGVVELGFVSEEEKASLMRGALALVQPSTNESFSIVLLEALLQGTPVIVHSECAVTAEHVRLGNCGLEFANRLEFRAGVELLLRNQDVARRLGQQGREYVLERYSWDAVCDRARESLIRFADGEQQQSI
jgi:glycosyltransferase involved in cell wall biosynthesis